ncbi:hypothetical protein [Cytobacillus sp. NCCP-133]|uniref:hypothetical protein n=1 Tax=Cytobacillus sp. NCCP-133 TaxID=766848 RepID=UPI00222EF6C0|nr:hypothetical protein [Cytobacillus sp. NCCP-133]
MRKDEIKEIFEESASPSLNGGLAYKIWLTGVWDEEEKEDIEAFLIAYAFDGERDLFTDELLYHSRIFKFINERADPPPFTT